MSTSVPTDFFAPEAIANPYPLYARLRVEEPLHRITLPNQTEAWLATRYEDALAILKDPRFLKNWHNAMTPEQLAQVPPLSEAMQLLSQHMLDMDPPDHTRLRALVHKAFTPRLVEQLRPRIQEIADTLIDAVEPNGTMDLIDDYAFPLPITVIAELLGVPVEDRDKFRVWSNTLIDSSTDPDQLQRVEAAMQSFVAYLRDLFDQRRAHLSDDLISALLHVEEAGDTLSEKELFSMVFLLLIAGHETTVNLISNGLLLLLLNPDQRELLQQQPELIGSAIEELLRYESPVKTTTMRFASTDIELAGVVIPRGTAVLVALSSANRDEARFAHADTLDITRSDNRHIAFGHGIHYCLGAPLARLEGQIAISTILRRLPHLRLAVAAKDLSWRPGFLIRGLHHLPVVFAPEAEGVGS